MRDILHSSAAPHSPTLISDDERNTFLAVSNACIVHTLNGTFPYAIDTYPFHRRGCENHSEKNCSLLNFDQHKTYTNLFNCYV